MLPPEKLLDNLKIIADSYGVGDLCSIVLDDPRFLIWSASSKSDKHHYGKHGLIIHTTEVIELCKVNNRMTGDTVDGRQMFLAALFHDAGKMWDYQPVDRIATDGDTYEYEEWTGTSHKRNIHHLSRSAVVWTEAVIKNPQDWDTDNVLHAILSHHGMREWGSPVAPNSKLAWLLHLCDSISARLNDCSRYDRIKDTN